MALATQCPHCHTKFRVAADQLKLRGGIVRCGACQSIFDGNAHLVPLDAPGRKDAAPDDTTPSIAPDTTPAPADDAFDAVSPAAQAAPEPQPEPQPDSIPDAVPDTGPEPVAPPVLHDATGRIEPSFGPPFAEAVLPPEPEPATEPATERATEPAPEAHDAPPAAMPATRADDAPPLPLRPAAPDDIPLAALPLRASAASEPSMSGAASGLPAAAAGSKRARALDARARRSKLTPTRIDAPKLRVPESDEPEFVKRSRRQERSGRLLRILMGVGAAVLLLALAVQALLMGRAVLAARHPGLQPVLSALCGAFGCRVGLPTQVENLAIETGELSPLGPGTYSLNTLLRNQGNLVQAWPSIELELVDDDNKPLLRRVFGPADYLPRGAAGTPSGTQSGAQSATQSATPSGGFAARSEQPVRIDFTLAGLTPAGYHLFVFYP